MSVETILSLVKARIGLTKSVRDVYLTAIIDGVVKELEDAQGLVLNSANPCHLMFIVDYSTWRYQNRDVPGAMPRHLQYRLHNLVLHTGGDADV